MLNRPKAYGNRAGGLLADARLGVTPCPYRPTAPRRVVSLVPSITKALATICPERLVGATEILAAPSERSCGATGSGHQEPGPQGHRGWSRPTWSWPTATRTATDVRRLRADGIPGRWVTDIETVPGRSTRSSDSSSRCSLRRHTRLARRRTGPVVWAPAPACPRMWPWRSALPVDGRRRDTFTGYLPFCHSAGATLPSRRRPLSARRRHRSSPRRPRCRCPQPGLRLHRTIMATQAFAAQARTAVLWPSLPVVAHADGSSLVQPRCSN